MKFTKLLLLSLAAIAPVLADSRTITGDLDDALAQGGNGALIIEWPHFTSNGGVFKPSSRRTIRITDGTYTAFALDSSQDATPAFSYTITYAFGAANAPKCSWSIPAGSTSVTITSIQSCPALPNTPAATVSASAISGLTSCGVTYGNSAGNLAQEPTVLCWDATNNGLIIGGTGSSTYSLDVRARGSAGTFRVYDQTPTTGVTSFVVGAGAGQGTSNLGLFQGSSYQGIVDSQGGYSLSPIAGTVRVRLSPTLPGVRLSSDAGIRFNNGTDLDSGSDDLGFNRNASGVVEINNGTSGQQYGARLLTGDLTVYDNQPATGSTLATVRAGAGQSGDIFQIQDGAGTARSWQDSSSRWHMLEAVMSTSTESTCDSSNRGRIVMVQGGAGVADTFRICRKDAADAYAFEPLF